MVEARAITRYLRMSPQKARLVLDLIRGKMADQAIQMLRLTPKRAAKEIEKCLRSAIANAEQKSENLDVDQLLISKCWVNEGPRWKRVRPAPFGRAYRYQRRTSHITIYVSGEEEQPRPAGAKPKAGAKAAPAAGAGREAPRPGAGKPAVKVGKAKSEKAEAARPKKEPAAKPEKGKAESGKGAPGKDKGDKS